MNSNQPVFKILVLSEFNDSNANVIRDFLLCFNRYSRHNYYYNFDPRFLDPSLDLSAFDVILLFWSIYYPGTALSGELREKIAKSSAVKALFLQDEYRNVRLYNQIMNELGVQLMFTCVAEKDHHIFYPPESIPTLQATYSVLTGYVPAYLEAYRPDLDRKHPIDIGYRSRSVPYYLGDLAREKTIIAEKFQQIALEYGFRADISVREEDRIYGRAWVEFLKSSRFVLGTPSGASVVDFNGEIGRNCERYLAAHPNASYEDVKLRFFADVDGRLLIDTVSPRIFESTAVGCAMVMHEGYYGGILEAGRHYICMKKDYSNTQDVIAQMRDEDYCLQIAHHAYQDLIASGKYSYREFVKWFDNTLDQHIHPSTRASAPSKFSYYARNFLKHGQTLVPYSDRVHSLPFYSLLFGSLIQKFRMVKKYLHYLVVCFQRAETRLLLGKHISTLYMRKPAGSRAGLKPAAMDLTRISILAQIVLGQGAITGGFRVRLDPQAEQGIIRFVSYRAEDHDVRSREEEQRLSLDADSTLAALSQGKLLLEWDHSPVDTHLEYKYHGKTYSIDMGLDGLWRFQALTSMANHFPELVAELLESVIHGINHG
jgi:hypothetical protein